MESGLLGTASSGPISPRKVNLDTLWVNTEYKGTAVSPEYPVAKPIDCKPSARVSEALTRAGGVAGPMETLLNHAARIGREPLTCR